MEERRYVKLARKEIDNLYNMKMCMDDYVNPTTDGALSWRNIISYTSYLEERIEHWKHQLHEVSSGRCMCITLSFCWIRTEVCDTPKFEEST
jgi:hypothetical protein